MFSAGVGGAGREREKTKATILTSAPAAEKSGGSGLNLLVDGLPQEVCCPPLRASPADLGAGEFLDFLEEFLVAQIVAFRQHKRRLHAGESDHEERGLRKRGLGQDMKCSTDTVVEKLHWLPSFSEGIHGTIILHNIAIGLLGSLALVKLVLEAFVLDSNARVLGASGGGL